MTLLELRAPAVERWHGRLELVIARRGARSVIARRAHVGPLVVQRPFHPEADGTCHVYVLHPPGGVVGGDLLELELDVAPGASALITTPAATKLYRSKGPLAVVTQRLRVRAGATLEWLPQETIAFGGAHAALTTAVELEPGARFLGWEIACLGRPASGDAFTHGRFEQRLELGLSGRPLLFDRMLTEGGGSLHQAAWGWGGRSVYACFVALGGDEALVNALREALAPVADGELAAVTHVAGATVCRYLGRSAARARACLAGAWNVARERLLDKPACSPRIWAT